MASGGYREGAQGQAYANRTDLNQAPTAAPGQQYGKAKEQIEAQKVVPLPAQPAVPAPGAMPFDRGSERPNEPVTAGLPVGSGPGPEALGPMGEARDMLAWKQYLPMLEHLASMPGSTTTTRQFVRRLRSQMPR